MTAESCPNCHEPHAGLYSHNCDERTQLGVQHCGCFHENEKADSHVSRDCYCHREKGRTE